jgi:hypothetical protein
MISDGDWKGGFQPPAFNNHIVLVPLHRAVHTGETVFNRLPVDDVDVVIPVSAATVAVSSPPIITDQMLF